MDFRRPGVVLSYIGGNQAADENPKKMKTYRITGNDAIRLARRDSLTIRKYADPIDGARIVTIGEAIAIAREDAGLVYIDVQPVGWTGDATGYNVCDYFQPADVGGRYNGAADDGVEPIWADAEAAQ